jgi:hypothetical protein
VRYESGINQQTSWRRFQQCDNSRAVFTGHFPQRQRSSFFTISRALHFHFVFRAPRDESLACADDTIYKRRCVQCMPPSTSRTCRHSSVARCRSSRDPGLKEFALVRSGDRNRKQFVRVHGTLSPILRSGTPGFRRKWPRTTRGPSL